MVGDRPHTWLPDRRTTPIRPHRDLCLDPGPSGTTSTPPVAGGAASLAPFASVGDLITGPVRNQSANVSGGRFREPLNHAVGIGATPAAMRAPGTSVSIGVGACWAGDNATEVRILPPPLTLYAVAGSSASASRAKRVALTDRQKARAGWSCWSASLRRPAADSCAAARRRARASLGSDPILA